VGQTWSTFSDPDADHEDLDFEGVNAENVIRQPQVRWTRSVGTSLRVSLAGELSQASITGGESVNQIPDLVARLRRDFEVIYGTRKNKDGQRGSARQLQLRLRYLF
jgi:hypothetical protein